MIVNTDILRVIKNFVLNETFELKCIEDYIRFLAQTRLFVVDNVLEINNLTLHNIGRLNINIPFTLKVKKLSLLRSEINDLSKSLVVNEVVYVGNIYKPLNIQGENKTKLQSVCIRNFNNKFLSPDIELKNCTFSTDYLFLGNKVQNLQITTSSFDPQMCTSNYLKITNLQDHVYLKNILCDSVDPILELIDDVFIADDAEEIFGVYDDCVKNLSKLNLKGTSVCESRFDRNYDNICKLTCSDYSEVLFNKLSTKRLLNLKLAPFFNPRVLEFHNLRTLHLNMDHFPIVPDFNNGLVFIDGIGMMCQSFKIDTFFPKVKDISINIQDVLINNALTEIDISECKYLNTANFQCLISDGTIAVNDTICKYSCGMTSFFDQVIEVPKNTIDLHIKDCNVKYIHGPIPYSIRSLSLNNCTMNLHQDTLHNLFSRVTYFSSHNTLLALDFLKFMRHKDIIIEEINTCADDSQFDSFLKYPTTRTFTKNPIYTS